MLKSPRAAPAEATGRSRIPEAAPGLPDRFRGLPAIDPSKCPRGLPRVRRGLSDRRDHAEQRQAAIDLGQCLFCGDCAQRLPGRRDHVHARLPPGGAQRARTWSSAARPRSWPQALDEKARRLFGRSLKLRQVSAGGCNACEADTNVLGTVVFDLGRFGIQFVASPRHADGLLITGPVTENMQLALERPTTPCPPRRS